VNPDSILKMPTLNPDEIFQVAQYLGTGAVLVIGLAWICAILWAVRH